MNPVRDKDSSSPGLRLAGVSNGMKRAGVVGILILAFLGIADSAYIAQSELAGTPLVCGTQTLTSCDIVAQSAYSYFFGVPIALYGVFFYSVIFILAALELLLFDEFLRRVLFWLSLLGAAVSIYLTLIEAFAIRAYCLYCLISAVLALCIAALAALIHVARPKKKASNAPPLLPMPPKL
ncbi:vitamin K epoxide reductase family protein [Candidatus Kaiserbacteria bacterium]|nr:vitamin K epoxide reductase family protein [Candidatus Kaiserbacteria bacterium]